MTQNLTQRFHDNDKETWLRIDLSDKIKQFYKIIIKHRIEGFSEFRPPKESARDRWKIIRISADCKNLLYLYTREQTTFRHVIN